MSAPYRTSEASLRAEVERLTRELATMRGRRATRWRVRSPGYGALVGSVGGIALAVASGHTLPSAAVALAACGAVWALCFVRRVPVDGGGQ